MNQKEKPMAGATVHELQKNTNTINDVTYYSSINQELIGDPDTFEWQRPEEFEKGLRPVIKLTSGMLPKAYRDFIVDVSYRLQVPLEYIAVPLITLTGSLIGRELKVIPKRKDTSWKVVPNLWGIVVGDPSTKKSPALTAALNRPIRYLENEISKHYSEKYENERDAINTVIKGLEVKKCKATTIQEARNITMEIRKHKENLSSIPSKRQLKINDVTAEALMELLSENPQGLLYYRDEISALLDSLNKKGYEQKKTILLESWNGDSPYHDHRIGRKSIKVEHACLSIVGGIQPEVLIQHISESLRKKGNDGFIQRFQLMVYPDTAERKYTDESNNDKAQETVYSILNKLTFLDYRSIFDSLESKSGNDNIIRFNSEAQKVFEDWDKELIARTVEMDSCMLGQHISKYESLLPSLALIFHLTDICSENFEKNISVESLKLAIQWCEYLESHAMRLYDINEDYIYNVSKSLSKKLRNEDNDLPTPFKVADIKRKGWSMLENTEVIKDALEYLEQLNWIKSVKPTNRGSKGGRPQGLDYYINPNVKKI
ncbi:YfjI family protein [Limisalsivibrio acetivorans]|uniref:YfjI family protein n=1 Tax=Limisalsivibrio acetivorans TaxID=1304888 RepID=UPI0003B60BBA|nr:YfjI family protein [Limisalsivibrio acetivorans]